MTANNKKSYITYLNKLPDKWSNSYHRSISEKIYADWLFWYDWGNSIEI